MGFYFSKGFLKLLARYRKGQSPAEEQEAMDTWYEALDNPDVDVTRPAESKEKTWMKIMERTSKQPVEEELIESKSNRRFLYYAAAAVVLLVSGLVGHFALKGDLNLRPATATQSTISTTHENDTDEPSRITLPDGSTVTLEPAAKLSYTSGFNKLTRTVRLEGNAFFSVAKNKHVPFIVQTVAIETKVLGTEFSIRKNAVTGETEVEVMTGKVEVNVMGNAPKSAGNGKNHVFLTANLKATFQPEKQELVMGLVSAPHIVTEDAAAPEMFVFTDSPLKEVIRRLESAYGVSINVANKEILNCPITANLSHEPLAMQLDIVMTALNASFIVGESGIQIKGGSCGPTIKTSN